MRLCACRLRVAFFDAVFSEVGGLASKHQIMQVLDLGLARNDNVIGAALQSHKDTCETSLVIMTERCVKVFNLH